MFSPYDTFTLESPAESVPESERRLAAGRTDESYAKERLQSWITGKELATA